MLEKSMNKGVLAMVALGVLLVLSVLVFRSVDHAQSPESSAETVRPIPSSQAPVTTRQPAPTTQTPAAEGALQRYGQLSASQLPNGIRMDAWSTSPADKGLIANFSVIDKSMDQIDVAALQQQLQPLLIKRLCGLSPVRRDVLNRGREVKAIVRDRQGVVLSEQTLIQADCGAGA